MEGRMMGSKRYQRALIKLVIAEPIRRTKVVAEVGVSQANAINLKEELENFLVEQLETVYTSLYGNVEPENLAQQDANNLIDGKRILVGWKNSQSGKLDFHPSGKIAGMYSGCCVFVNQDTDTYYYPVLLEAEIH
jgi:hypothetical protein